MRNLRILFLAIILFFSASAYDKSESEKFAAFSYASYCKPSRLATWDVGYYKTRFPDVQDITTITNDNLGTLAFLSYVPNKNQIVITFRGTNNMKNWEEDFKDTQVKFNDKCGCKVHQGFLESFQSIRADIYSSLSKLKAKHSNSLVAITGHSLGGAMATLLAADMYSQQMNFDSLYTFGSPRVGDKSFQTWFEQLASGKRVNFRVTNGKDPVPHGPPQKKGYYHINQEIFYENGPQGSYKECSFDLSEDPSCQRDKPYKVNEYSDHSTYMGIDSPTVGKTCE